METTIILARMLAVLYITIGLGILLNRERYTKIYQELLNSPALLYVSGIVVLLIGWFIVSIHNEWETGWPLVITIFGWVALIKGALILALPRAMQALATRFLKKGQAMTWEGLFALGLGIVMTYLGFAVS